RSVTTAGGHSPLESGVNIEVIDFNATLDERYCVNGSCVARRGLYNLYVPVAGHTPTAPVLIRFSIPGDRYLDSCGSLLDFQHKACHADYNFNINHAQEPLVTR
ncbi:CBR-PQN-47 protein, partial [Aphelenchoides avenae]